MNGQAGKGDKRRAMQISHQEWDLRWDLFTGKITREEFDERVKNVRRKWNGYNESPTTGG